MPNEKDIAVVGMACTFARAPSLKHYWSNLVHGVDAIGAPGWRWKEYPNFSLPPDHEMHIPGNRGGYLPDEILFDPLRHRVLPNLVKHGDPDQFMMLQLVDDALRDAGVGDDSPLRERTDVIVGRGGYPTGKLIEVVLRAEIFEAALKVLDRCAPNLTAGERRAEMERHLWDRLTPHAQDNVSTCIPNIVASRTANRLNLHGAAYTVDAACASSLIAVEHAVWRLRTGQADLAVAGGLFITLAPTFLYVFTQLGAISRSQVIRPFDRRADGLLAGEGGGAVVLKRLDRALADGDTVYALIKGVGSSSDGRDLDVLAPSSKGQLKALERAYADADLEPDAIQYLEAHGTGTVAGDLAEIESIKKFFGTSELPPTTRCMGSVKSMIGHTMPAAGMASLIKTVLALSNKIIPPSLHCEEPHPELANASFFLCTQTRPWVHNPAMGPRRAGVNAFGFGGVNAHIIVEEVPEPVAVQRRQSRGLTLPAQELQLRPRPIEPALSRPTELLPFTAATRPEMAEKLRRVIRFLDADRSGATLVEVTCAVAGEVDLGQPVKLALICQDVPHLRRVVRQALEKFEATGDFRGLAKLHYSDNAVRHEGKIAVSFPGMTFPGLIGTFPDHLMQMCLHYPEVRAEFDIFEDRDRHPEDNIPTSSVFWPPPVLPEEFRNRLKERLAPPRLDGKRDKALPCERYLAGMGVTLADYVGWVLLKKFQVPVDLMIGQSQGEVAALCAAGYTDFHEAAPYFWKVANVDPRTEQDVCVAFAWCSAERIQPLLDQHPDTHVAIYMTPEAVIFSGARTSIDAVVEQLQRDKVLVQTLPYPPVHTPLLGHLKDEMWAALRDEKFQINPPQITVYSSITTQPYPTDQEGVREWLLYNVDKPLRVWQTMRRIYEDGVRIYIQVGGGHLTHLDRMLPEGAQVLTAAMDLDGRDPITQLNTMCATLFVAGVPMTFDPLYEHRRPRRVNLDAPQEAEVPSALATPLRQCWNLYANLPEAVEESHKRDACATAEEPSAPRNPAGTAVAAESDASASRFPPEIPEDVALRLPILGPRHGRVTHFVPEQELTVQRTLDLNEDLFLHDHLFVHADFRPLPERVPVVPLTMSMEFAAEAASLLAPGLGLIGYEEIRGKRWISLLERTTAPLRIEARLKTVDAETGVRRIHVELFCDEKSSFSATVLYAAAYREDFPHPIPEAVAGPWPCQAEDIYGLRLMFHGPAFQVMADLGTFATPVSSATLVVRPRAHLFASLPDPLIVAEPAVMDGFGQTIGLWAKVFGHAVLPTGAEKIELYGPAPPVGALLPIRVEVVEFNTDTRLMRCNMEIEDGQGGIWARVAGWSDWLLNYSKKYDDLIRFPDRYLIADELVLPGLPEGAVCTFVSREDVKGFEPDWAARLFCDPREGAEFLALNDRKRQRFWLCSRAATKDAARRWWERHHGEQVHPARFGIHHDSLGRPFVEGLGEAAPHVSGSNLGDVAVGLAASVPVGIDLEPFGRASRTLLPEFATAEEIALVDQLEAAAPGQSWETRLWCAKEAVAKVLGTGLQGRPKDFVALDGDPGGDLLMQHGPTGRRFTVHTLSFEEYLLAYTSTEDEAGAEGVALAATHAEV